MKKYIPNPVRESLKFYPEVEVNKSSTKQGKNWEYPKLNKRFAKAGEQESLKDDNHNPAHYSVESIAQGKGCLIESNQPVSGVLGAEEKSRMS